MDLTKAVHTVMDAAGRADIAVPNIVRDVRRQYPIECDAAADAAIQRLISSIAKRRLKPAMEQERLPGFDVPARIPLVTEGGFIWRSAWRCTVDDFDAYEQLLVDGIERDRLKLGRFRTERRRIVDLLRANGVDTLEQLPT